MPAATSTSETEYCSTPLHGSVKPSHRTLSAVSLVAYFAPSPSASSTDTAPPAGPEQHSLAPSDATACCKPAQLVARTAK